MRATRKPRMKTRANRNRPALIALATVLAFAQFHDDAWAQRRRGGGSRGSVRSVNRSGNGGSWSGRYGSGTTSRDVSGNRSTRSTTYDTRGGETVSGSRSVTREDDSLNVDRSVASTSGASASKQKEYEFDDGRLESVERDVQATDRSGRTVEYEGKAERSGYGVEFEGEGKNRWGQDVEAEGYGARGYYGAGAVADIEGGRYGDRTVVAGRTYGGPTWTRQLPHGAQPYMYHGRRYYHHGGHYYHPYHYRGVPYYAYMPPPYYSYYDTAPVGAIVITLAVGKKLLYSDGSYYETTYVEGATQHQVVPPPAETTIPANAMPPERATVTVGGQIYFFYGNSFYRQVLEDGQSGYVTVTEPPGVIKVEALPADFEPVSVGGLTYFKTPERYFLTYLKPSGEEFYLVVDAPQAAHQAVATVDNPAASNPVPVAQPTLVPLTLGGGTPLTVRVATESSSATARPGQRFQGHLDDDLIVEGRLVVGRSATVYGRVAEAKAGTGTGGKPSLGIELTDITIGGRVVAITTQMQRFSAEGAKPGKKIIGGAALGAGIGAIIDGGEGAAWGAGIGAVAGTAKAAGSPGSQVAIGAGTVLEFRLATPVTIQVLSQTSH